MLFVLDERSSKYNNGDLIHSILYAIKESLLTTKPRTDHGASLYDNMQEFRLLFGQILPQVYFIIVPVILSECPGNIAQVPAAGSVQDGKRKRIL